MCGFNKRVYRGILDDDPIYFADVFWYGLKKLDQFSEGMVKVDEKAWQNYVDNLARAYAEPAEELATGMDKQQLEGFSKAVKALTQRLPWKRRARRAFRYRSRVRVPSFERSLAAPY